MQAGEAAEVDRSELARKSRTSNARLVLVRDTTCIRLLVRQSRGQCRAHADVGEGGETSEAYLCLQ